MSPGLALAKDGALKFEAFPFAACLRLGGRPYDDMLDVSARNGAAMLAGRTISSLCNSVMAPSWVTCPQPPAAEAMGR